MKQSKIEPTFKVGDVVTTTEKVDGMLGIGLWQAVVMKVKTNVEGSPDGCAYETHGFWTGKNAKKPRARQLWSNHLELIDLQEAAR